MIDPNETPDDLKKRELLQSFRRGWLHGASHKSRDPRFTEHKRDDIVSAYRRGYEAGEASSIVAASRECERLQYDPRFSVLRNSPPIEPPESRGTG